MNRLKKFLPEFRLYLCNNWINRIPSHTLRLWYYRKIMKFKIGKDSSILMRCTFDAAEGFEMGNNSVINANCRIDTRYKIIIGNNVSVSANVIILTAEHDMNDFMKDNNFNPTIISDYVWIGTNAMILPDVHINMGAVVAAGAVVTKNVEERDVVAGVPATTIKKRNENYKKYKLKYRRLFQ
ncbi:MAG: acyltransferase [Prevotellaceae bacterium]|jgi:maltose O-acetyltransferase|nr:acyltransferase [Prevotellaceae bacterium]